MSIITTLRREITANYIVNMSKADERITIRKK